ncbi:pectinesterase-like [Mercurialis annua]|uniref:pectinesterase-like n=1 Tax=Mercurialis annua TaxID=3986 RepID=UPI002160F5FE|nr:pectinesterase-like [Mercurialis annua]
MVHNLVKQESLQYLNANSLSNLLHSSQQQTITTMYSLSRERTKLLLTLLPISLILLFIILLPKSPIKNSKQIPHLHIQKHYQVAHSACHGTLYPNLCVSTLSSLPDLTYKSLPELISSTISKTIYEVKVSASNCSRIKKKFKKLHRIDEVAIDDCLELFGETIDELSKAMSDLSSKKSVSKHVHDLQTLLSGAMTNQYTCLDGFARSKGKVRELIKKSLINISRHVSNSLAMLKKIPGFNSSREYEVLPSWLSRKDVVQLQAPLNATRFDLIVAKDGSGNFTNITDAVAAAPKSSATRFVIYIKAGAYFENVEVEKKKTNLMFIGDGIGKTVVKANRSVVGGWTTFRSATVAVVGKGFVAKGITFENSAGPSMHQAVALRSGSDLSAFYQCSFVGYQDTLYVHSLRQFYSECDIYGTVDFIFGNAAVVFQNCSLYARKPNPNQKNIFTAQGREDPNQNTGISIMNSKITAASDLIPVKKAFKTFLGRPWKEYSRTVIVGCYIDDAVEPVGWLEWNATFALSTLYYGEYMNRGPGSNTSSRVSSWPGYRVINSSTEAHQFTVEPFIQGREWLNDTGVPYFIGLN